jgi:glycerol-3-phosphate O-acyltransferase
MMKQRMMMAYHLEIRRERSGKIKQPDEFIFENYINAYLRNIEEVDDVMLVPITINYDKVYEGHQFPFELLGEEKPKESLIKILKQFLFVNEP